MPKAFMNASFEDGLLNFAPRLRDGSNPSLATGAPTYSTTLYISET
jgi:hypothetical protein